MREAVEVSPRVSARLAAFIKSQVLCSLSHGPPARLLASASLCYSLLAARATCAACSASTSKTAPFRDRVNPLLPVLLCVLCAPCPNPFILILGL